MRSNTVENSRENASTTSHSYPLVDAEFKRLQNLVMENTRIQVTEDKRDLLNNRLQKRVRKLGLSGFAEYCDLVESPNSPEFEHFVNAVTTNLTSFFRENHHFEHLASTSLPALSKTNAVRKRLRVWSAGCSTGEEPYSIAMVLGENERLLSGWDVRVLATDLDSNVVATASDGLYKDDNVAGIGDGNRQARWFTDASEKNGYRQICSSLRDLITFKQLNLFDNWPFKGPFDVIFCRNVVIYFDKPTQRLLFDRFYEYLSDDGFLYVGHSESLNRVTDKFERVGNTIYRKIK